MIEQVCKMQERALLTSLPAHVGKPLEKPYWILQHVSSAHFCCFRSCQVHLNCRSEELEVFGGVEKEIVLMSIIFSDLIRGSKGTYFIMMFLSFRQ